MLNSVPELEVRLRKLLLATDAKQGRRKQLKPGGACGGGGTVGQIAICAVIKVYIGVCIANLVCNHLHSRPNFFKIFGNSVFYKTIFTDWTGLGGLLEPLEVAQ